METTGTMDARMLPFFFTYAFMIISNDPIAWNFGFIVFLLQTGLAILTLADQFQTKPKTDDAIFIEPFHGAPFVSYEVSFSQFFGILLSIVWQTDIRASIEMFGMLRYSDGNERIWPYEKIYAKNGTFLTWFDKVFFPNMLRFMAGLLVLLTSFEIILQSENVIELFKDFTALILISEIDNLAFSLANKNYFGCKLKDETEKISNVHFWLIHKESKILLYSSSSVLQLYSL